MDKQRRQRLKGVLCLTSAMQQLEPAVSRQTAAHTAAKYTLKSAVCTLLQTDTAALTWQLLHFKQLRSV